MPRAFTSFEEAKKFNTTKTSQERLHGRITAIEVEGQSSIAAIDVDGFAGLQAKIKLGSLKYEGSQPAAPATTQQPETNAVAGLDTSDPWQRHRHMHPLVQLEHEIAIAEVS